MFKSLRLTLQMIKFEHTLFALPFAFLGGVLAAGGIPTGMQILWITLAMAGARSAAMAFNRIADLQFDADNPRTKSRPLAAGTLSLRFAWIFTIASGLLFLIAAGMLNRLTLLLSPVALASVLLYSYTKRFTSFSHLVLGWCLSLAPTGAWIAVKGSLDSLVPVLLSAAVMFWTAGFDILYACQDLAFDVQKGLFSIPRKLGIAKSLWISRLLHAGMLLSLGLFFSLAGLGWLSLAGIVAVAGLLVYEHSLVSPHDLSRLDAAFFTTNAFVSVILFVFVAADKLILSKG